MSITKCTLLLGAILVGAFLQPTSSRASAPDCPIAIGSPSRSTPLGGTITVRANFSAPCIVQLPDGVRLRANSDTAPPPSGRAIFRISGTSLWGPAGISIVVSVSSSPSNLAPETSSQLNADAVLDLPRGAELVRFDPVTGQFVRVSDGHLRLARPTLYRVIPLGRSAMPVVMRPTIPATLPDTGGGQVPALLAALALIVAASALIACCLRRITDYRRMMLYGSCGALALVIGCLGVVYTSVAVARAQQFGALSTAATAAPARDNGATRAPTRIAIARLGIDVPVTVLDAVDGRWQVPAYSAGYLAGSAWPGHAGNETITGHDDRDGSVFRRLTEVRAGDVVRVYAGARLFRYLVLARRVVAPTDVAVLRTTHDATLTLITCTPFLVDTQRLIVRARLLP